MWYKRSAPFATAYARTSPSEDFSETFAEYFMDRMGKVLDGGQGVAAIQAKVDFVDRFLSSLE